MAHPLMELVAPLRTARGMGNPLSLIARDQPGPALFPEWDGFVLWKGTKTVKPCIPKKGANMDRPSSVRGVVCWQVLASCRAVPQGTVPETLTVAA